MKKIILSLALLSILPSCHLLSQNVNINPQISSEDLNISRKASVDVSVKDKRSNQRFIGKRWEILGGSINNYQDVSKIIRNKIVNKLTDDGFTLGSGRTIDISLTSLDYRTRFGIFSMGYDVECSMDVIVKSKNNTLLYNNSYREVIKTQALVAPTDFKNERKINQTIAIVINSIFEDEEFVNSLKR